MTNNNSAKDDDCEVDGRFIDAVAEYASTCDGCGELTMHDDLEMDDETQLGYCYVCTNNNSATLRRKRAGK